MGPVWRGTLLAAALFLGACATPPTRHPVAMVPIPLPEHQKTTLAVGGGAVFDAEEVIAVEADKPDIVRAYATKDALELVGEQPGKVTLKLHLLAGDFFYFDVEVTSDPPAVHALVVSHPFVITYDGVKDYALSGKGVTAHKSIDETQLIVTGSVDGPAFIALTMADGSIHRVELLIIDGQRLL